MRHHEVMGSAMQNTNTAMAMAKPVQKIESSVVSITTWWGVSGA